MTPETIRRQRRNLLRACQFGPHAMVATLARWSSALCIDVLEWIEAEPCNSLVFCPVFSHAFTPAEAATQVLALWVLHERVQREAASTRSSWRLQVYTGAAFKKAGCSLDGDGMDLPRQEGSWLIDLNTLTIGFRCVERSRHCLLQSLPVDTWLSASNALMPWLPAMENERCDILPLRVNAADDNRSLVHLYCPQSFSVLDTVLGIDQWNSIADLTSGMLKVSHPEPLHAVPLPNLEHG